MNTLPKKSKEELEKLKSIRDANLSLYKEYNKILRAWLVAFGIAVPAVFVTSKDAKDFLISIPNYKYILIVFLLGVVSQIAISFLNKFVSWSAYHRDDCVLNLNRECKPIFKLIAKLENYIWIDLVFDVLTFVAFGWAMISLIVKI